VSDPAEDRDEAVQRQLQYMSRVQGDLEQRVTTNEKAIALMVRTSVAEGIHSAVADPKVWDAFFAALGNRAQNQAGEAAVGGLKWLGRKILWTLIVGGVLYAVGGWALLVKFVTGAKG